MKKRLLILRRELRPVAEADAGRRAGADVDDRRQAVGVVGRPLAGAVAPAELAAAGRQADARRPVPRRVDVPLHVGVVGEQVAVAVEGGVVLVAVADAAAAPSSCRRGRPCRCTRPARATPAMKPLPSGMRGSRWSSPQTCGTREPASGLIRRVSGCRRRRRATCRRGRAGRRAGRARRRPAIARSSSTSSSCRRRRSTRTRYRPLGSPCLAAAVDHDVQAVERPEQALGLADVGGELLDLGVGRLAAERRRGDAVQAAVLVARRSAGPSGRAHMLTHEPCRSLGTE